MKYIVWNRLSYLVLALLLGACARVDPPAPQVVRLEITPAALLLTKAGESQTLSARAFDAEGKEITTSFSWSSSRVAEVTVDAAGKVSAVTDLGSALITAEASGVKSAPATVLIAQPVAGAVLVADDEIIGQPQEVNPDQAPKVGSRYRVVLTGASPPSPGTVLIGAGGKAVAGKVVSATPGASGLEVVLERRPITEVFERISLNLQGSLQGVKPSFAGLTQPSRVQTFPDGRVRLSYAPALGPQATRKIGPFDCEFEASLEPADKSLEIEITQSFNFDVVLETEFFEVRQLRLKAEGSLGASVSGGVEFGGLGAVGTECRATLLRIPIPVSGPIAAIFSPVLPLGLKFSVTGELKVVALEVGLEGEAKATVTAGVDYTPEQGLKNLSSFEAEKKVTPKFTTPDDPQLRVEAKVGFQGTIGIGVGNALASLEIIEVAIGPVLEASLMTAPQQALDTTGDPSSYELKLKGEIGPGQELKDALELIFSNDRAETLSETSLSLVSELALASSPTGDGDITTERATFKLGDVVKFKVPLDPANLNFLPTIYNVKEVQVYRKTPSGGVTQVAKQQASSGQRQFDLQWTASEDGVVENNFIAFVQTRLLPFVSLELGTVKSEQTEGGTLTFSETHTVRRSVGGPDQDYAEKLDEVRTDQASFQLHKKSGTSNDVEFDIIGGTASISEQYDYIEISRHQKLGNCEFNETIEDHYALSGIAPAIGTVQLEFGAGNIYHIGASEQVVVYQGTETWTAKYEFLSQDQTCRTDVTDVTQRTEDSYVELSVSGTVDPNNPKVFSGSKTEDLGDGRTRTTTWTLTLE